jgi:hypothetical protein
MNKLVRREVNRGPMADGKCHNSLLFWQFRHLPSGNCTGTQGVPLRNLRNYVEVLEAASAASGHNERIEIAYVISRNYNTSCDSNQGKWKKI